MELTLRNLKKAPVVNLARQAYYRYRFHGLMFDAWRYFVNGESRKLYRLDKERMAPSPLERKVIRELEKTGISMVHLSDLMPGQMLSQIQEWAEAKLRAPEVQERIKVVESGGQPVAKSGKFYIVKPIGDYPVVDIRDPVMDISLSESILRIVCGYLGMFSRLAAIDLWYNVAIDGPDVFSQRWHRDPEDRVIVKTFLYLRDVDETDGPFCYVPGTHKPGALRQKIGRLNYPSDGVIERKFPPHRRRMCTGKAGTLIFCDTTGFHKGGHPTAGARFLLNSVYTSNASEPISTGFRQFSLKGAGSHLKSPAAGYAIGHALKR
jgi:hypothetical protein